MLTVLRTEQFTEWLGELNDKRARIKILQRIDRAELGNFGDHKAIGGGVSEMRIDYGPGYRLYYTVRGSVVICLLCGGDKSTQARDIKRAQQAAQQLE